MIIHRLLIFLHKYLGKNSLKLYMQNILQITRFSLSQILNKWELVRSSFALDKLVQSNFEVFQGYI